MSHARFAAAAATVLSLGAPGCQVTYRAELVNASRQNVNAMIVLERSMRDRSTLEEVRVDAGESRRFQPVPASLLDKVRLEVVNPNDPGLPPLRGRLEFGDNRFELTDRGEFGDFGGGLRLNRVGSAP